MGVSVSEPLQGHDYVPMLGWFQVWQRGQRVEAPREKLSADSRERRAFAERLADTLAYPGADVRLHGHGGDLVGAASVYVPVAASLLAQRVVADAEAVTEQVMGIAGETRVYHAGAGVVVLVHGPDWSLVFEISSVTTVIRVCGDELGEVALSVDEDPDRQVQSRLLTMTYDVLFQLQRLSVGGDRFTEPGETGGGR